MLKRTGPKDVAPVEGGGGGGGEGLYPDPAANKSHKPQVKKK